MEEEVVAAWQEAERILEACRRQNVCDRETEDRLTEEIARLHELHASLTGRTVTSADVVLHSSQQRIAESRALVLALRRKLEAGQQPTDAGRLGLD
jgi:hypothetical protein